VRSFVAEGADDGGLAIVEPPIADAQKFAGRREPAFAHREQIGLERPAVGERDPNRVRTRLDGRDPRRGQELEVGQFGNRRLEREAERAVRDDPAERLLADLAMVVADAERAARLAHEDLEDRLGIGGDRRPSADGGEEPLATARHGGHPAVVLGLDQARERRLLDEGEPGTGSAECCGEREACEPAPGDRHFDPSPFRPCPTLVHRVPEPCAISPFHSPRPTS
jgi:hypothetical protein